MKIPRIYRSGYKAASAQDPAFAETYMRHTMIGDQLADRAVEEMAANLDPSQVHVVIGRAMDVYRPFPAGAPESLRDLIDQASGVPDWYDREITRVASRAFFRNPEVVLAGLATGAIVEGFSTLISKSFFIRGRITDSGVRRLKQNNLHLLEQFLPGGPEPGGDGWRLTLRIRLVHAQVRYLLRQSDEWDEDTYGMPVSAAHVLLGAAAFSGRLMQHVARLGGRFSAEERAAYVHVWRYIGRVLGIPEDIMFEDEASSLRAFQIGSLCEPTREDEAIIMANCIINSVPVVLGVTNPKRRGRQAAQYYRVSRALIGDAMADGFRFPPGKLLPILPVMRLRYRLLGMIHRLLPSLRHFNVIMQASEVSEKVHSYRLPTALLDSQSDAW